MNRLTNEEKAHLSRILEIIYGHDSQLLHLKNRFNEKTVEATEQAFSALAQCNENMKSLVMSLIAGGQIASKGWLREPLNEIGKSLESDRVKFEGAACRNAVARNWKTEIVMSTYGI